MEIRLCCISICRGKINNLEVTTLNTKKVIKLEAQTVQDIQIEDYIHLELIDQNIKDKIGEKFQIIDIHKIINIILIFKIIIDF